MPNSAVCWKYVTETHVIFCHVRAKLTSSSPRWLSVWVLVLSKSPAGWGNYGAEMPGDGGLADMLEPGVEVGECSRTESETDKGAAGECMLAAAGTLWALLFWEALLDPFPGKSLFHHVVLKTRMTKWERWARYSYGFLQVSDWMVLFYTDWLLGSWIVEKRGE